MEQMRKEYNEGLNAPASTTEPQVTPERQAVLDRMAKMRAVRKKND